MMSSEIYQIKKIKGPDFAEKVEQTAKSLGVPKTEFLKMFGSSRQNLKNWRNGASPSLETLVKFDAAKKKFI